MDLETALLAFASPAVTALIAIFAVARSNRDSQAKLNTQTAVLTERIDNLKGAIPDQIKAAVDKSRMALTDALSNGLGERIIKPVMEELARNRRADRHVFGEPLIALLKDKFPEMAEQLKHNLRDTKF